MYVNSVLSDNELLETTMQRSAQNWLIYHKRSMVNHDEKPTKKVYFNGENPPVCLSTAGASSAAKA